MVETPGLLYVFLSIGLFMLIWGILVQTGLIRAWWLLESNPIAPEAANYLGIPASVAFFIVALSAYFPNVEDRRQIFGYGLVALVAAFIVAVWRPRWLTPKWLLWLEEHHHDILGLLRQDARELGGREWSKRTRTQAGLEEWVAEVRRKHGL